MPFEILVPQCVIRPSYAILERAYGDYRGNPAPAGPTPRNQCAVRMSVALGRAGFGLESFPVPRRVKTRSHLPVPFVVGAHELASYLETTMGRPERFPGRRSTADLLQNRKGIIYFNDCFRREDGSAGDHIDLWNGSVYFNQVNNLPAGAEDPRSSGNLFGRSNRVWFWGLA
ncbi:type VI secretion system amidase effector protein Tae4 [Salmonirosea aquatica]